MLLVWAQYRYGDVALVEGLRFVSDIVVAVCVQQFSSECGQIWTQYEVVFLNYFIPFLFETCVLSHKRVKIQDFLFTNFYILKVYIKIPKYTCICIISVKKWYSNSASCSYIKSIFSVSLGKRVDFKGNCSC